MRYAQIRSLDISNGDGIGVSLFVQGCHFHCHNCFNQETWDFNGGKEWNEETEKQFLNLVDNENVKRVSILGGEPLESENLIPLSFLVSAIKSKYKNNKKIWLYTGWTYENIVLEAKEYQSSSSEQLWRHLLVNMCDYVVDGLFIDSLKNQKLKFRGSENQRIIDIPKTVANKGSVILKGE